MARARRVVEGFGEDDCGFLAGGVAYQLFFSLVPLLAVVIGAFALVYGSDRASGELASLMRQVYPAARQEETDLVRGLVEGRALSLGLGLIGTLLSASAIYGSLDIALSGVLGRDGRRRFIRDKLEALLFMSALGGLALLSFGASYGLQLAQDLLDAYGLGGALRVVLSLTAPLIGLLPGLALFYFVFRLVPRKRVPPGKALRAAVVSAVLWEVAKLVFALLTRALGLFHAYGALAFAAGLLTWVYVTAAIILVGAEFIKTEGDAA